MKARGTTKAPNKADESLIAKYGTSFVKGNPIDLNEKEPSYPQI